MTLNSQTVLNYQIRRDKLSEKTMTMKSLTKIRASHRKMPTLHRNNLRPLPIPRQIRLNRIKIRWLKSKT